MSSKNKCTSRRILKLNNMWYVNNYFWNRPCKFNLIGFSTFLQHLTGIIRSRAQRKDGSVKKCCSSQTLSGVIKKKYKKIWYYYAHLFGLNIIVVWVWPTWQINSLYLHSCFNTFPTNQLGHYHRPEEICKPFP